MWSCGLPRTAERCSLTACPSSACFVKVNQLRALRLSAPSGTVRFRWHWMNEKLIRLKHSDQWVSSRSRDVHTVMMKPSPAFTTERTDNAQKGLGRQSTQGPTTIAQRVHSSS